MVGRRCSCNARVAAHVQYLRFIAILDCRESKCRDSATLRARARQARSKLKHINSPAISQQIDTAAHQKASCQIKSLEASAGCVPRECARRSEAGLCSRATESSPHTPQVPFSESWNSLHQSETASGSLGPLLASSDGSSLTIAAWGGLGVDGHPGAGTSWRDSSISPMSRPPLGLEQHPAPSIDQDIIGMLRCGGHAVQCFVCKVLESHQQQGAPPPQNKHATRSSLPPPEHPQPVPAPLNPHSAPRACVRSVAYQQEAELRPDAEYLHRHSPTSARHGPRLSAGMRRMGLGWMVEVALDQGLTQEALSLAVSLLDRYMSAAQVRVPAREAAVVSMVRTLPA